MKMPLTGSCGMVGMNALHGWVKVNNFNSAPFRN
jgi:hypothetical protein